MKEMEEGIRISIKNNDFSPVSLICQDLTKMLQADQALINISQYVHHAVWEGSSCTWILISVRNLQDIGHLKRLRV